MKIKFKQSGLTLMEMTVVIVVIALLTALSMPAVRTFFSSMATSGGTRSLISASLSSARAVAAKKQRYAGIRFQKVYDPNGLLNASQYIIFIVQDPEILAWGFRAVEGIQPIKLPDSVGVMDLIRVSRDYNPGNHQTYIMEETRIANDVMIAEQNDLIDTTAFSIVFSPSGKMVIHEVRVRNKNGFVDSTGNSDISYDDVFNKKMRVDAGLAMFYQDDYFDPDLNSYPDYGLGPESSRSGFIIYEKDKFKQAYDRGLAWSDYLSQLRPIYINPYTGTIIN